MRRAAWWCGILAVGLTTGCVDDGVPAWACVRPIAEYCARRKCPSYEDRVAEMESWARRPCEPLASLRIGTCGDLRYTSEHFDSGGDTRYYDSSGNVVAANWYGDVVVPSGCGVGPFGFIPQCQHAVARDLCRP